MDGLGWNVVRWGIPSFIVRPCVRYDDNDDDDDDDDDETGGNGMCDLMPFYLSLMHGMGLG